MEGFFLTLGVAFSVFLGLLGLFIWSVRSGQWEDLDSPPEKILWDENEPH